MADLFLAIHWLNDGLSFYYYGTPIEKGTHLLIDEIHQPKAFIPKRMSPLIFISAILTQIFGGSAGREAPAVQLSGALTDHLTQVFKVPHDNRKIFLIASIGSGFAAIFGLPLAGAIYGLEITSLGKLRYSAVFPCFVSAVIASQVPEFFHIVHPHHYYVVSSFPELTSVVIISLMVAGLIFGIVARIFIASIHFVSKQLNRYIRFMPFRPMVGGILIMLMTLIVGAQTFNGLGVHSMIASFIMIYPLPISSEK